MIVGFVQMQSVVCMKRKDKMSFGDKRLDVACDRYITGNYGEDQFSEDEDDDGARMYPDEEMSKEEMDREEKMNKEVFKKEVDKQFVCCLCKQECKGYGNNPAPLKEEGKCCDNCNLTKVIPARLGRMRNDKEV